VSGHPVVGFVGNCQSELLSRAFRAAAPGCETVYRFYDEAGEAAVADVARCDILVLQDIQNVEDWALYDRVGPGARIVRIPFLRFAAPWPYDDFNGARDLGARAQDDPSLHTVTYYDSVLAKLRKLVSEPEARLAAYRRLDAPQIVDPLRVLDFEARRLIAMDEKYGVAIGADILARFRARPLFYTVNRPCGELLAGVLALIGRETRLALGPPRGVDLDELEAIECPVHPRVAETLGIPWATPDRRYARDGSTYTFEEHARDYIRRYG
jgi:hypothetical protein